MTVLKFGAVWCNGCLVMRPRWQEIEKENPWLKTNYYDFDTDKEMVQKYGITGGVLPIFIFLDKNGKEIYENDIYQIDYFVDEKYHVQKCGEIIYNHDGFKLRLPTLSNPIRLGSNSNKNNGEVIGNIYENPELKPPIIVIQEEGYEKDRQI